MLHPKKPDNDGWTKVLARPGRRSSEALGSDTRSEIKIHPEQARRRIRGALGLLPGLAAAKKPRKKEQSKPRATTTTRCRSPRNQKRRLSRDRKAIPSRLCAVSVREPHQTHDLLGRRQASIARVHPGACRRTSRDNQRREAAPPMIWPTGGLRR